MDAESATYPAIDGNCNVEVNINRVEAYGHKAGNAGNEVNLPDTRDAI